jgi:hypothetical protein
MPALMTDATRSATTPADSWARNIWALTLIVFVAFVGFQFFFVTAAMCALALVTLIFLFTEVDGGAPDVPRRTPPRLPVRDVFGYPHFAVVLLLLMTAQFLDRGLALLIPLQVTALPGTHAIAATSGLIISVAAVAATVSANVVARLSRDVSPARLLMVALALGGPLCAGMALVHGWPTLLVLRALVGLTLGGRDHACVHARRQHRAGRHARLGLRLARPRRADRDGGQSAGHRRAGGRQLAGRLPGICGGGAGGRGARRLRHARTSLVWTS